MSARSPRARRAFSLLAGVVTGLVIAEAMFWVRDLGAFPHVNFYVPDSRLAVRLRPGAGERISFGGNPVSRAHINSAGYRGAELGPPRENEVIVVGDSQVFGLGVDDDQTFSSRLAQALHAPVVNAGVPTYGPAEYNAVLDELLSARKARRVVYVVNFANDLFEAAIPNTARHVVWDGWAVRRESAPGRVHGFPGRSWLFNQSHAVFALRSLFNRHSLGDRALPSEGTWRDLLGAHAEAVAADKARRSELAARADEYQTKKSQLAEAERDASRHDFEARRLDNPSAFDILTRNVGEAAPPPIFRVPDIEEAADYRTRIEEQLKRKNAKPAARAEWLRALASLDDTAALRKQIADLSDPARAVRSRLPIYTQLERAKAICDAHGARLWVVALPLDVQVSPAEAAKYGGVAPDLKRSLVLLHDVVATARELGASAVDALPPLRAAEPGAFLKGDLHMSPTGHAALAAALARALAEPPPLPLPAPGLPPPATPIPDREEWAAAPPAHIGQAPAFPIPCTVSFVRRWARVKCHVAKSAVAITVDSAEVAPAGEQLVLSGGAWASAVVELSEPLRLTVGAGRRFWSLWVSRFSSDVEGAARVSGTDSMPENAPAVSPPPEAVAPLWKCAQAHEDDLYGSADPDCLRTYQGDCEGLLACARGDWSHPPACANEQVNVGPARRCAALCDPRHPCEKGACTEYMGAHICKAAPQ